MSFQFRYFGQHPSVVLGDAYASVTGGDSSDSSDSVSDFGFRTFTPSSIKDELPADYKRGFGFASVTRVSPTSSDSDISILVPPLMTGGPDGAFDFYNTGKPIEKVAQSAINGLPPLVNGFLDSESPFLSIYQQRYLTTMSTDQIAGGEGINIKVHASSLNYDLGGDADDDEITFEEYLPQYAFAPYTGLVRRVTRLANKSTTAYKRPSGGVGLADSVTAGTAASAAGVADALTVGGGYELAPLVETTFSDRSRPLITNQWFRTGTGIGDADYKFEKVVFGSIVYLERDEETGLPYYAGSSSPINKNAPFISDARPSSALDGEDAPFLYTVEYGYMTSSPGTFAPADKYKVTSDIESRFRTEAYVNSFSNALISDRMDKITALLGVSIDREADIKMQKNSPLSYNAISSIVAELQPVDDSTPVTADTSATTPGAVTGETGPAGGMAVSSVGTAPGGSSGY